MKLTILAVILCVSAAISHATICQPFSSFKIDCNICKCSQTGKEYSCSKRVCRPEEFSEEVSDDGYILVKPKKIQNFDEYSDYVLINKKRHPRMPYLEEMPIELESNKDGENLRDDLEKFSDFDENGEVENLGLFN